MLKKTRVLLSPNKENVKLPNFRTKLIFIKLLSLENITQRYKASEFLFRRFATRENLRNTPAQCDFASRVAITCFGTNMKRWLRAALFTWSEKFAWAKFYTVSNSHLMVCTPKGA